jgi:hypothetical protein
MIDTYLPVKVQTTECSETLAFNIQTQGKYPEENIPYLQHGESLKTTISLLSQDNNEHGSLIRY